MEELRKGHEFELELFIGKLMEVQKAMVCGTWRDHRRTGTHLSFRKQAAQGYALRPRCCRHRKASAFPSTSAPICVAANSARDLILCVMLFHIKSVTLLITYATQSASYIIIAIMAAALYPETLKRAQAELDDVVGRGRGQLLLV